MRVYLSHLLYPNEQRLILGIDSVKGNAQMKKVLFVKLRHLDGLILHLFPLIPDDFIAAVRIEKPFDA